MNEPLRFSQEIPLQRAYYAKCVSGLTREIMSCEKTIRKKSTSVFKFLARVEKLYSFCKHRKQVKTSIQIAVRPAKLKNTGHFLPLSGGGRGLLKCVLFWPGSVQSLKGHGWLIRKIAPFVAEYVLTFLRILPVFHVHVAIPNAK